MPESDGGLRGSRPHFIHASVRALRVECAAPAIGSSGALLQTGSLGYFRGREGEVLVRVEELKRGGSVGVVEARKETVREVRSSCLFSKGWKSSSSGCCGKSRQDWEEGTHDL